MEPISLCVSLVLLPVGCDNNKAAAVPAKQIAPATIATRIPTLPKSRSAARTTKIPTTANPAANASNPRNNSLPLPLTYPEDAPAPITLYRFLEDGPVANINRLTNPKDIPSNNPTGPIHWSPNRRSNHWPNTAGRNVKKDIAMMRVTQARASEIGPRESFDWLKDRSLVVTHFAQVLDGDPARSGTGNVHQ
jgi:hypothetical protein